MKNLILIFALFVGLFSNAQLGIEVVEDVVIDGTTYNFIQPNELDTSNICLDNIDQTATTWLPDQILLNTETRSILMLNANYRILDNDYDAYAAIIAHYRSNGVALYNQAGQNVGVSLLECAGQWNDANADGWFTNSDFPRYAYNPVVATSGNAPHAPQLVANYGGSNPDLRLIADGGQRIYVGSFPTNEAAVTAVEDAIRLHMNPLPESGTSTPTTAVDQWNQGGVTGWLPPAGFDSAWSNPVHPGFAYSINEWTSSTPYANLNPHLIGFNAYIGIADVSETSGWRTEHIGTYQTNELAVGASQAYITSRSTSSDSYETTAVGSYLIINAGFSAYYVEILTPQGTLVEFRAFSNYDDAVEFARDPASFPAQTQFTAADFDTTTHANPGWLRGVYQGGIAGYTVTAPTQFSGTVTATWTWTDSTGFGHTGNNNFTVPSTTRYYHGSTGVYYDDIAAIEAAYPNNFQVRLDSGHFTILHSYEQADIDRIQAEAVAWAIQAINDFAPAGPNPSN